MFKARFVEFQPDGEQTGIIYITYAEVEGDYQVLDAQWKNPTTPRYQIYITSENLIR